MTQADKASQLAALHVKGRPLVLYNVWDAGSARSAAKAGSKAIATGSWSMAAAHGFDDGEAIPLDLIETIVGRIASVVALPLTVDFEGGYAQDPDGVAKNAARIIAAGAVGLNFEDQIVGTGALYAIADQVQRIKAIRSAADDLGIAVFINARTDLFLLEADKARHASLVDVAIERAQAYQQAGCSGFFIPGLLDESGIATICDALTLPVNVMVMGDAPDREALTGLGVSRISYGPGPYLAAQARFVEQCAASLAGA
ncbi:MULTISPECIES: isocitrate lyase/phosphoenolpyruvate mutase family protein [unclassified Bosea (in: a-proteobacteria)]|uniref:isocitrate lyase/PEP mutase family protein n=1 Tax=unclassified Bosea (in: a-proteobacteria) TaxID=2653178 RepID=UPI000F7551DB|nr:MULTISPECIES: isocitrate lyase/phosphoenolpyruvate mutase family protein [unclassified Bosea (in: a-proteobacteria)]AZO81608.1 phosphonomutase [Bosea sp. Tri-49]RXT16417.1 phosphonomutase [Bosea sp. Tri-39]RXT40119.1 phosphonomutase [Bosea sp. Tri-54]